MDGQLESISNDVALVHGRDRERERESSICKDEIFTYV